MEALAAVWGVDNARSLRWRFRNEWAMMGGPVGIADGRLLNAFHEAAMTHPTERTTHGTHDHIL